MRPAVPAVALVALSFALGWAVFLKGGTWPDQWCISLLLIGFGACLFWLFAKRDLTSVRPLNVWMQWLLIALPAYIAITLIPLPSQILDILSPTRGALLHQLQPVIPSARSAPLSVRPPSTALALFTVLGYIAVFLTVREIAIRMRRRPWIGVTPIVLIAGFEAGLGILQSLATTSTTAAATGTYANRDHFAGLLEMALPLALLYGCAAFQEKTSGIRQTKCLAIACASWVTATLLFVAILYSFSRMGFIVALFELFLIAALSLRPRFTRSGSRLLIAAAAGSAIIMAAVLIVPDQLAGRFAALSSNADTSTEIRAAIWRETLPLISEFKLFGCGLGGFASVFLKHQATANVYTVEFAHNDYLQYLVELGIVGFSFLAAATALLARDLKAALLSRRRESNGFLLIACTTSLAGMALHSFVDFNTYIPANALVLAWIAGVASAASATAAE